MLLCSLFLLCFRFLCFSAHTVLLCSFYLNAHLSVYFLCLYLNVFSPLKYTFSLLLPASSSFLHPLYLILSTIKAILTTYCTCYNSNESYHSEGRGTAFPICKSSSLVQLLHSNTSIISDPHFPLFSPQILL